MSLSCEIPALPVAAGAYVMRIVILDADSLQPLALRGFEDAPVPLRVHGDPSLMENVRSELSQLVTIDVDWSHVPHSVGSS